MHNYPQGQAITTGYDPCKRTEGLAQLAGPLGYLNPFVEGVVTRHTPGYPSIGCNSALIAQGLREELEYIDPERLTGWLSLELRSLHPAAAPGAAFGEASPHTHVGNPSPMLHKEAQ